MDLATIQQRIAEKWPGRQAEVASFHALVCSASVCDAFVYGVPSTGKTSVIRCLHVPHTSPTLGG